MLTTDLYPYQDAAVDRAVERGSLLIAYTMGLGKTLVALAAIEELAARGEVSQTLLVVPAGVKWQWAESIAKFTDVSSRLFHLRKGVVIEVPDQAAAVVVDGSPDRRKLWYTQILDTRPEFAIVSYEQVRNDFRWIRRIKPDCIVLDEASAIKGFTAKRSKLTKRLDAPFRFALTGTPVENRPEEAYSIMEWVDPDVLGRFDLFDKAFIVRNTFGGVVRYKNMPVLHKKLASAMVRKNRTDPDVAPYLPDVQEDVVRVTLAPQSAKLYRRIVKDLSAALAANDLSLATFDVTAYYSGMPDMSAAAAGPIMARTGALLMLCDHPRLLVTSARLFAAGDGGSAYAHELLVDGHLDGIEDSAKMERVVTDVVNILDADPHAKLLVFSFFKDMVAELADRLGDYSPVTYTGDMTVTQKAAARIRFQQHPDVRLFVSSDAGGYGVDLPQANHLINYDLAWSAGKMDQRNARHVRVGSTHEKVYIVNYLIEASVEERTYRMLALKRRVASAVVDGIGADAAGVVENTVGSLTSYLDGDQI